MKRHRIKFTRTATTDSHGNLVSEYYTAKLGNLTVAKISKSDHEWVAEFKPCHLLLFRDVVAVAGKLAEFDNEDSFKC